MGGIPELALLLASACGPGHTTGSTSDGGGGVDRRATSAPDGPGQLFQFPLPNQEANPNVITAGPDGNIWFSEYASIFDASTNSVTSVARVAKITPAGQVTEYDLPGLTSEIFGITAGPDGNVWFTDYGRSSVGVITPDGHITEYPTPTNVPGTAGIVTGRDGNLWFIERAGKIGTCTRGGQITEQPLGSTADPGELALGSDGNFWFTQGFNHALGRITPSGVTTEFMPSMAIGGVSVADIAAGPDGNLWFTEILAVGRITTSGAITEFPVSGATTIAAGPDGNVWFIQNDALIRTTPDGSMTAFAADPPDLSAPRPAPVDLTTGPDGAIWFTATSPATIGRFVPP